MTKQYTMRPAVAGDTGDVRPMQLDGVQTLQGASNIECNVWSPSGQLFRIFPCTLLDGPSRLVEVPFGQFLRLVPNLDRDYEIEIAVNSGLANELTFPAAAPALLPVRAQLGARAFAGQGDSTLDDVTSVGSS